MDEMKEPKVMTFGEWVARHPELDDEETECETCNSTGVVKCADTCPGCGKECNGTVICADCHGTGHVSTLLIQYREQLEADKKRWDEYCKSIAKTKAKHEPNNK